ncbi:MAG: cupredoxin domain-containing protein [Patescibacteria group bacterium]|nr:cupredoxin domain-containing protein [Patescibacteria group bacterium]
MEVAVKIIITVLFITLIAIAIVFFGIFGIAPLTRLADRGGSEGVTTTVVTEVGTEPEVITGEEFEELQEETRVLVPEASPVTQDGEVVTQEGAPVKLDVEPGSPEAPQQSNPINEESLPEEAVKLQVSASGFLPSTFKVKTGDTITLSLTTADDRSHIFKFKDPSLSAVAIGVGTSKTRAITFNAPSKGDYSFFCDVPGHELRGETGVMVVE